MKTKLLTVALLSILGSTPSLAVKSPDQYVYQVALFNGDKLLYKHSLFTSERNHFSNGNEVPYFIKTCEKKGSKTISKSGGKQFYEGVAYHIDVQAATVKFFETVIDESTYTEPKETEFDLCMNTGEPQEVEYEYKAKFDLTESGVQRFTFDNNRIVEIVVQKEG
ncbi:hypothetical protein OPW33_17290 [Vibrio europaeus]|uniref:hypothetical protein n=1 Tax=Vibrio europaeus TaxID=300876 RepID=UPI0023424591|nr:hypothetical protein [Vibrio europaeus]MDC5841079.1 hypothetical protein [Vibrio europaeus]